MLAIEIKNLTKKYQDFVAVNDLNLSVNSGELFSLLGLNGAGKTTTIKILCGLTSPTSGEVFINNYSVLGDSSAVKKIVSISPQETAIARNLTVYENLELICDVHNFSIQKKKEKILKLTAQLGLDSVIDKKAYALSGGWQRRLSIAMALISEPEILFLDEPTLGLDVVARRELWDLIKSLKGKMTIVLTTHYLEEAVALSDRIGIMKEGKLLVCDSAKKIISMTCTNDFEQAFIKIVKGE